MVNIVSIKPAENVFSMTWLMTKRCNYDCMYCPPEWHDNSSKHLTLTQMQEYWEDIFSKTSYLGLKYKIGFTGGEVASNKNFIEFVKWLRIHYGDRLFALLLTTNGSATENFYWNLYQFVDNISFSVHSEFFDEGKFFNMILKLRQKLGSSNRIHVNIMDEFWNQERIEIYKRVLGEGDVNYSVNVIDYSKQTRAEPRINGKLHLNVN